MRPYHRATILPPQERCMATAYKSCNVALFPSLAVVHQAIEWSQSVSGHFKTKYVLDGQTYYPHITLYQAHYPIGNLTMVQESLAKVAEKVSRFNIDLHNFSVLSGFIFYDAVQSAELLALHHAVIEALNPLREGILTAADRQILEDARVPEKFKQNIQQYAYAFAKESYVPHMSITRLVDYQEAEAAKKLLPATAM